MRLHQIKRFCTTKEVPVGTKRPLKKGEFSVQNIAFKESKNETFNSKINHPINQSFNKLIKEFLREKCRGQYYILLKGSRVPSPLGKCKLNYQVPTLLWSEWLSSSKQRTTDEMLRKRKHSSLWAGMKTGPATQEVSMEVQQQSGNRATLLPLCLLRASRVQPQILAHPLCIHNSKETDPAQLAIAR